MGRTIIGTDHDRKAQKFYGDYVQNELGMPSQYAELKCEAKWTGNLAIELWSNRRRGTTGWFYSAEYRLMMYYFEDRDKLYEFSWPEFKSWASDMDMSGQWVIDRFPQKCQRKHEQLNDTWIALVPIGQVAKALRTFQEFSPKADLTDGQSRLFA